MPRLNNAPLPPALREDKAARIGVSRRRFFLRISPKVSPQETSPAVNDVPAILHSHRRKSALLNAISQRLGGNPALQMKPILTLASTCRNHGACAAHCPSQALQAWQNDREAGITFDAASCLECSLCVRACPEKALSLSEGAADMAKPSTIALSNHTYRQCRQCGAEFSEIDAEGLCSRCKNGVGMLRALLSAQHAPMCKTQDDPSKGECHEYA
jgi:ferredoxin